MHTDPNCIFCKIIEGKIPSRKAYEDEEMVVIHDISPWAPVHLLMLPREHIPSMAQVEAHHAGLLGRMLARANELALAEGCRPYPDGGYRIGINTGADAGQEVHHLHIHVYGGPRPWKKG